jgi:hypothetical protein
MPLFLSITAAIGISIATMITGLGGHDKKPKESVPAQTETSISTSSEQEGANDIDQTVNLR